MKTVKTNNNLVGRRVVIDWPCRWRGAKPEFQAQIKADTREKEAYYGEEGEIVAYNPSQPEGNTLTIVLDNSKEIIHVYHGAVTIKTVAPAEQDHKEVVDLLRQILEAIQLNNNHG